MRPSSKSKIDAEHLEWLIDSRTAIQSTSLRLWKLFEKYPKSMKSPEWSPIAQSLTAACFSMWRAAFLADRTGHRHDVSEHAKAFLEKMLADNVINFAQDRQMREWTFNYYMNNAVDCLLRVSMQWNDVKKVLNAKRTGIKGKPLPRRRWDRQHAALEFAITEFEESLQ